MLCCDWRSNDQENILAGLLIDLSMLDREMFRFMPSTLAAAALFLSRTTAVYFAEVSEGCQHASRIATVLWGMTLVALGSEGKHQFHLDPFLGALLCMLDSFRRDGSEVFRGVLRLVIPPWSKFSRAKTTLHRGGVYSEIMILTLCCEDPCVISWI